MEDDDDGGVKVVSFIHSHTRTLISIDHGRTRTRRIHVSAI